MVRIGYARVSSVGQGLDVQLDKLQHCEKVFHRKQDILNVIVRKYQAGITCFQV